MKSILIEIIGMAATCVGCAVVFCGLQCVILSSNVYEAIVGSKS